MEKNGALHAAPMQESADRRKETHRASSAAMAVHGRSFIGKQVQFADSDDEEASKTTVSCKDKKQTKKKKTKQKPVEEDGAAKLQKGIAGTKKKKTKQKP